MRLQGALKEVLTTKDRFGYNCKQITLIPQFKCPGNELSVAIAYGQTGDILSLSAIGDFIVLDVVPTSSGDKVIRVLSTCQVR